MARTTNATIMEKLDAMMARFDSLESRLTALETSQKTSTKPSGKASTKKSAPQEPKEPKTVDPAKFAPKDDSWKAYKAARSKYLKAIGLDYESTGWVSREQFAENCKPWSDMFHYIKKADRKEA